MQIARKFLILLIICTILKGVNVCICVAQLPQYQLSRIAEQEGLKTADIINITRDKNGYMWLALQSQVQKFDGKHSIHYPFSETVTGVYADSSNRIWVSTRRWVYKKGEIENSFSKIPFNDNDSTGIETVFEREGKGLFVIRRTGLYRFNVSKQLFEKLPDAFKIISGAIIGYHRDNEVEYWSNTDSVIRFNPANGSKKAIAIGSKFSLHPVGEYKLLVSTTDFDTWLVDMNNGSKKLMTIPAKSGSKENLNFLIFSSQKTEEGKFLLATNKGLLEYNLATAAISAPVFYYNGQPLQNKQSVRHIFRDKTGAVFICHPDGIFQKFSNGTAIQYFRNYSFEGKSMNENDVRNFTEDEDGNIWMATSNGISRLNMNNGNLKVFAPTDENNPIDLPSYRQLLNDGPYIWIGSSGNGVWLLEKSTGRFKRPVMVDAAKENPDTSLFNTYIWKLLKLPNEQMLVVGGGRCFIIDIKSLQGKRIHFESSGKGSRAAYLDASGRIWHGTTTGFYCLDNNFQLLFHVRDSFPDLRVAAFCEWKKDRMLIGTKGLYEAITINGKLTALNRKNAIPADRFIYCMKQDKNGIVWLGTDDGLYRYDPVNEKAVLFGQADYVQTQAFNSDAAFLSSKGIIFMGGKNGVNYFDPNSVKASTPILHPMIGSFALNGNDTSWHSYKPIELSYQNRDIDFTVSAPEFRKPFSIRYRYKLSKTDPWINNGYNDRVRVNNLAPGKYDLRVSASVDGIVWFDANETLAFSVAKPWWQTWWFRLLYILFIFSCIWLYSRYRKEKYKAEERKRAVNYFALSGDKHSSTADILWDIARNCISRLGFEDCVIYLLDEERHVLVQKAAYGEKSPKDFQIANPIEVPVGKGITGAVAQSGKTIRVADTSLDGRYILDDGKRYSELAVPILHDKKVIGVIDSEHHRKNFFSLQQQQTLEQIANICSSKIARAVAEESVKKAAQQLQELDAKMTESKFMNLRLQMNPHFLFNILTSIQYQVVSGQTSKATKYLNLFAGFLRALLHYAEATVVSLEEEIKILHTYVELETLSLDESFDYKIDIDDAIEADEVLVPFMLLQPFIENAIHHGLVPKVGEKKFCIVIKEQDDESMLCTIIDNGVGRQKAAEINDRKMRAARHQSRGVAIALQRLELLGRKTGKVGNVTYEDIVDNEGRPGGTKVKIIIPYYSKSDLYD